MTNAHPTHPRTANRNAGKAVNFVSPVMAPALSCRRVAALAPPPACTRRVTDLLVLLAPDIGKKKRARAALDAGVPLPAHAPVREPVRHLLLAQVVPHRALFVEFQIIAPGCANAMRMHNLRTTSCTTSQAGMRGTPGPAPAAGGALRFTSAHSLLPALRHVHRDRGVPREFHAPGGAASTRSPGAFFRPDRPPRARCGPGRIAVAEANIARQTAAPQGYFRHMGSAPQRTGIARRDMREGRNEFRGAGRAPWARRRRGSVPYIRVGAIRVSASFR